MVIVAGLNSFETWTKKQTLHKLGESGGRGCCYHNFLFQETEKNFTLEGDKRGNLGHNRGCHQESRLLFFVSFFILIIRGGSIFFSFFVLCLRVDATQ